VVFGRIEPRLVTPVPAGKSFGPALTAWAKRVLNIELMEWQKRIVNDALTLDADGDFVFREACVSTARQCGKSLVMRACAGFFATEYAAHRKEPQTIVIVANQKRRSMALFRDVVRDLEEKFECKVRWQNGDERINFPDGSSISVVAASAHAHGMTASVLLCDELWDLSPEVVFTALRPSQVAVKNPMMMMFSTAGDQGSTVLLQLREQGMAAIDSGKATSLYFAEWSLPPDVSIEDRSYWGWANPALGTTITMKALELAYDSPNRQAFIRGHLNLWLDTTSAWLPLSLWSDRVTDQPMPAYQWLTIDSSIDESRYIGIGSAFDGDRVIVTTAFVVESAQQMWEQVVRIMSDPQVKLACTPSLEIHCPPDLRRRMTIVGYAELLKWTSSAKAMIVEDRVRHTGDLALAEHMARSVAVKTGGTVVLSSQKSPGPIELARCAVWGMMLASKPTARAKPAMAFG
jgi:phage terminase large subunit-like protein